MYAWMLIVETWGEVYEIVLSPSFKREGKKVIEGLSQQ